LAKIEKQLLSCGKSLSDFPPMPQADKSLIPDKQNILIHEETNYNRHVLGEEHARLMSTMIAKQRGAYDTIMTRVNQNKPGQ